MVWAKDTVTARPSVAQSKPAGREDNNCNYTENDLEDQDKNNLFIQLIICLLVFFIIMIAIVVCSYSFFFFKYEKNGKFFSFDLIEIIKF